MTEPSSADPADGDDGQPGETEASAALAAAARTAHRLRLAAGICLLEALAALVLAVVELASLNSSRISAGVTTAVFFVLYAVGLALCARGLSRARSWSRGPIVLAQLIQLGVAWSFRGGASTWVAVVLAIPAFVVLIIVFSPDTTTALYGDKRSRQADDPPGP